MAGTGADARASTKVNAKASARTNAQVTVSIPWDVYRAVDREREGRNITRSTVFVEALRDYLARRDEAERERRDGLGEKIEELLELVKYQADRLSGEARNHADRQAGLTTRSRRAAERVYALLEAQMVEDEDGAYRAANDVAGKRLKAEAERDRRRRAEGRDAGEPETEREG